MGKGIGTEIIQHLLSMAVRNNFRYVVSIASSPGSQRIFRKLGFTVLEELDYSKFVFEDRLPFKGIDETPHALLMYKKLATDRPT